MQESIVKQLIQELDLSSNDIFYDLGSGYGRLVLYTRLTTDVGGVKGIELVTERVKQCNAIKEKFGLKNIEFINKNVMDVDFSNGNVFFLFNPFNARTLDIVGKKLAQLAATKPIRIVSWGLSNLYFYSQDSWLRPVKSLKGSLGEVVIFESKLFGTVAKDVPTDNQHAGGIDFNPEDMDFDLHSNGEIRFKITPAMIERLKNIPGFVPLIINVQPMTDLKLFLGASY